MSTKWLVAGLCGIILFSNALSAFGDDNVGGDTEGEVIRVNRAETVGPLPAEVPSNSGPCRAVANLSDVREQITNLTLQSLYPVDIPGDSKTVGVHGALGISGYPLPWSRHESPNGIPSASLATVSAALAVGTSRHYCYFDTEFWLEKPDPGVTTNANQGDFDFTKRESDNTLGCEVRPFGDSSISLGVGGYSFSNLNRGYSTTKPMGYQDGFFITVGKDFTGSIAGHSVWGQISAQYYPTKGIVTPEGTSIKPLGGVTLDVNTNLTHTDKKLYAFLMLNTISTVSYSTVGIAWRPFQKSSPNTEFRVWDQEVADLAHPDHGGTDNLLGVTALEKF